MKVYITGIGVISAIGDDADQNLDALRNMRSGIERSEEYGLMLGKVKKSNDQLAELYSLDPSIYSRTFLLSLPAAMEAWAGQQHRPDIRTGLISATSVGGMDRIEQYYYSNRKNFDPEVYSKMVAENGMTTEQLAGFLGIKGFVDTVSTACSSGLNSIMNGARMIKHGMLDRVLVGACDPLAHFDVMGFRSLGIYDDSICKPFDQNRAGLNLGEGAAFLVLESEESIRATGSDVICELSGWSNTTDAYHQTASSPEGVGASLAMNEALQMANMTASDIAYLNAHGTGTPNNDASEWAAISKVFGEDLPEFSSTKGYTGHTLAAAGAIEAVFSVMALKYQVTLPNVNLKEPMNELRRPPVRQVVNDKSIKSVMSNSFGFGGNCSTIILNKS